MNDSDNLLEDTPPYRFGCLDPRDSEARGAVNADLLGSGTLGIEVTVPALAAACGLGNIDPQHQPLGGAQAAIEAAIEWPVPALASTLVTIRPDLDSLGAMALLAMRANGQTIEGKIRARIGQIAQADRFANGPWPGPRSIVAALAEPAPLAPLALAVADAGRYLAARVALLRCWLAHGEIPEIYCDKATAGRRDLAEAVRTGALRARPLCRGRIAAVVGDRPEALRLGYCLAPVVVALNPAFRLPQGGPPHRKFTVAQYRAGHTDFDAVRMALGALEPGWGGSATILGSPQGIASRLSLSAVARRVRAVLS